jgi:glycosyltransferase 2 family protein
MAEPRVAAPVDAARDGEAARGALGRMLAVLTRLAGSRVIRWGFVAVAVGLAAYALVSDWTAIRGALAHLGLWSVAGALLSVLAAYAVTVQVWRLLLTSLGSPLPYRAAAKVLLVGQIGKYVPGSVWPVLASMELGKAHQVPRSRSASASVLQMLLSLITGLIAALVTLPFVAGSLPYWWALLAVPVLLVGLYPRVLNAIIGRLLRAARQPPPEVQLTVGGLLRPMAWSLISWLCYGLQIWILAVRLGAPPGKTALLAVGAFAFAWSVGFVVVFAPAGAGIRDVLLLVLLGPVLRTSDAAAVVLVSRALTTIADLVSAAFAARSVRPRASQ